MTSPPLTPPDALLTIGEVANVLVRAIDNRKLRFQLDADGGDLVLSDLCTLIRDVWHKIAVDGQNHLLALKAYFAGTGSEVYLGLSKADEDDSGAIYGIETRHWKPETLADRPPLFEILKHVASHTPCRCVEFVTHRDVRPRPDWADMSSPNYRLVVALPANVKMAEELRSEAFTTRNPVYPQNHPQQSLCSRLSTSGYISKGFNGDFPALGDSVTPRLGEYLKSGLLSTTIDIITNVSSLAHDDATLVTTAFLPSSDDDAVGVVYTTEPVSRAALGFLSGALAIAARVASRALVKVTSVDKSVDASRRKTKVKKEKIQTVLEVIVWWHARSGGQAKNGQCTPISTDAIILAVSNGHYREHGKTSGAEQNREPAPDTITIDPPTVTRFFGYLLQDRLLEVISGEINVTSPLYWKSYFHGQSLTKWKPRDFYHHLCKSHEHLSSWIAWANQQVYRGVSEQTPGYGGDVGRQMMQGNVEVEPDNL